MEVASTISGEVGFGQMSSRVGVGEPVTAVMVAGTRVKESLCVQVSSNSDV